MEQGTSCLQRLKDCFITAQRNYQMAESRIRLGKYEKIIDEQDGKRIWVQVENLNYKNVIPVPTSDLSSFFYEVRRSGKLKLEIESNWFNNNNNYFIFFRIRVGKILVVR